MSKRPIQDSRLIYTLKITLKGLRPPIWRRGEVLADGTLGDLHRVIQGVMAWEEAHMHQFVFGKARRPGKAELEAWRKAGSWNVDELWGQKIYGDPLQGLEGAGDEWGVTLAEAAPEAKTEFDYEYDFGDGWEHKLVVEKIGPAKQGVMYPRCVAGKMLAPAEDSGGVWGWMECIRAAEEPQGDEDEDRREWMGLGPGETFDASRFDLEETNRRLAQTIRLCEQSRKAWIKESQRRKKR